MSYIQEVNKNLLKVNLKDTKVFQPKVGDIISVEYFSVMSGLQIRKFVGICISNKESAHSINNYVTLRNIFDGFAMEFSFYLNWPQIVNITKVGVKFKKLRRAKLYYLRKQVLSKSNLT